MPEDYYDVPEVPEESLGKRIIKVALKLLILIVSIPVEVLALKYTVVIPCEMFIVNVAEGIGKLLLGVLGVMIVFLGLSFVIGIAMAAIMMWLCIDE